MFLSSCSGTSSTTPEDFENIEVARLGVMLGPRRPVVTVHIGLVTSDGNACTDDICDPITGVVSHPSLPEGSACPQDGNVCNGVEACNGAGACVSSGNVVAGTSCSDGNFCNGEEACNGSGTCVAGANIPVGTVCDDGDACNGIETCNGSGTCAAGTPLTASDWDDHNPCTDDTCDSARGGIVNTPNGSCTPPSGTSSVDPTVPVQFASSTEFLYTGATPIQTGVSSGTIDAERVGVVRGRVLDTNGSPFSGATVTILNHPELGQTVSRSDGWYDLAVNGGGALTVNIEASGRLPMQRTVKTSWHEFEVVPDVMLVAPQNATGSFTQNGSTSQLVVGALTPNGEDADGARRVTLYFPPNTQVTSPAGFTNGTSYSVQATEYTRTPDGQKRMPGDLPATVGYTYAVELGIDGQHDIAFDRPVVAYVDNFTGSPVGTPAPLGTYDRGQGAWKAEDSGRIIKVLASGVDVDGDNVADTGTKLTALGITADELSKIASTFTANTVLWRVQMTHFSAWDINWGFGPPDDAEYPPEQIASSMDVPDSCEQPGSIIGCENQSLAEEVPIVGTPYFLRYQSDRTKARVSTIRIRLTDDRTLDPMPEEGILEIHVGGNSYVYSFLPYIPNQVIDWVWSGKDAYGREVPGTTTAYYQVGYEYAAKTTSTSRFGYNGGGTISGDRAARSLVLWKYGSAALSRDVAGSKGFGSWMFSAEHTLDFEAKHVVYGDGRTGSKIEREPSIDRFAGIGGCSAYPDEVPAKSSCIGDPTDVIEAPNGEILIAHNGYYTGAVARIRRVDRDGVIHTVAGLPPYNSGADGSEALHAPIKALRLALGPDGSIYFAEYGTPRVRRIKPGSPATIETVAGTGSQCTTCGLAGPATLVPLVDAVDVAVASDGTVYLGEQQRVRRVGTDGYMTTLATMPESVGGLIVDQKDDLYVQGAAISSGKIWRFSKGDGQATPTYLTNAMTWICEPGEPHPNTNISTRPAIGSDGSIYVACLKFVERLKPDGLRERIAGTGADAYGGDGGSALRANLYTANRVTASRSGAIFISDTGRIRKIEASNVVPYGSRYLAADRDTGEIHEFSSRGEHLATRTPDRGATLRSFMHDSGGLLTSVTDWSGTTTISRSTGSVTITSPFGHVTTLGLDGYGHLSTVTMPKTDEVLHFAHSPHGLLTDFTDARGQIHHFDYDPKGRLVVDKNAAPGTPGIRLESSGDGSRWTVDLLSPEGRKRSVTVDRTNLTEFVTEKRSYRDGVGLVSTQEVLVGGGRKLTAPDGTTKTYDAMAFDPRWRGLASYPSKVTVASGTKTFVGTQSRTATLSNEFDPFTVTAQTLTSTVTGTGLPSGLTTTSVFASGTPATWTTTTPEGRQVRRTLDAQDRPTKLEVLGSSPNAIYPIQIHYDANGRIDEISQGSRTATRSFDGLTGWLTSTTDALGRTTTVTSRDANGRPLQTTLPGSRTVSMGYDLGGFLTSVTPPGRTAHGFTVNVLDQLGSYSPPPVAGVTPNATTYGYDLDAFLTTMSAPAKPLAFEYDAAGRVTKATDTVNVSFGYDGAGRLASVSTSDGPGVTYAYDGAMMTSESSTAPSSHSVGYAYDSLLRPVSQSIDGANALAVTYDKDGLLTAVGALTLSRGASTGVISSTSLSGGTVETRTYDGYGVLASQNDASGVYQVAYDREVGGRVHEKTETLGGATHTTRYEYDVAGRLYRVFIDGAGTPAYEYTYTGNGSRASATLDAQDRTVSYGGATYTYGPNGERATKTVAGATTTYVYDARGNLREVTTPSTTVEYVVDGLGRRVGKKVAGSLERGWVWSGNQLVAEVNAAGAVTKRFVYATGRTAPDYMVEGANTYRVVSDQLGSVRAVLDAAGSVVLSIDYDPYGKELAITGTRSLLPFGFAGGIYDPTTGLVRFGARDYDPELGAWTSKDPSRFAGGLNLYAYANNDPTNFIDVDGHHPLIVGIGLAIFVIGYGNLFASDDAQIQAQTHPEMHDSPVLGILGSVGVLAPLGGVPRMCSAAADFSAAGETITFGRNANQANHAFRHVDELGLTRAEVQAAIERHLATVADRIPNGQPLNQVIEVAGQRIQYSAFRLPDGTINVGRIHGIP